ncbi:MAG: amino acid permease [Opitutaceae bacterium]|nr:amino acid permease [Opitutaceae bacterium]
MSAGADLRRSLGFWSATAIVTGTVIGAGIFRTPASIASVVHDPRLILGMWVFFGAVSICGALALAELAAMMPSTGGTYVYLRAAYGDAAAFVFGWLYLLAATPSGMAALAVFFGELVLAAGGADPGAIGWGIPLLATGAIALLSAANIAGVRAGATITNVLTCVKVGGLLTFVAWAFASGAGDVARWWTPAAAGGDSNLAAAAKSVLFTCNGWVYVSLIAGEVREPERLFGRIIIAGTGAVIAIYLLANLAYLYLIPLADMRGMVVAREGMRLLAGPAGAVFITLCILGSVLGSLNGVILTKARVPYALGRDGLSFSFLGRAHPTRVTPHWAIAIQGTMAIALVFLLRDPERPRRLFDRLTAYFIMVEWLALLFAIAAVFVLRIRRPDAPRPFRTPGYPFVPAFFVGGTLLGLSAIMVSSLGEGDWAPVAGLGIVAAGFPTYWLWRKLQARAQPAP